MSQRELWQAHDRERCLAWSVGGIGVACRGLEADARAIRGEQVAHGISHVLDIDGPDGVDLEVRDFREDSQRYQRHILCSERRASPERFDRLKHGARLWVSEDRPGRLHAVLYLHAWSRDNPSCLGFPTRHGADLDLLRRAAGTDVRRALLELGATGLLRHEENLYRVEFPESALRVPVAAYLLTRVLPIWRHATV